MDVLKKSVYLAELYSFYAPLLTEKQRAVFEDYYYANYSLAEIAATRRVSRSAIYYQLSATAEKLLDFEAKLGLARAAARRNALLDEHAACCPELVAKLREE